MANNTYSPEDVVVSVNGFNLSGYMSGTFITASREVDTFTKMVGNDGEVSRTKSANRSGQIEITLMQTSQSNDFLSALHLVDETTGSGRFVCMVKDLMGKTLINGAECWLLRPADIEYGDEVTGRVWTVVIGQLNSFAGGSND